MAGRASDMERTDREDFYAKQLDTLAAPERTAVLERHLVAMPLDIRGKMLSEVAAMCTGPERTKIWKSLGGAVFGQVTSHEG